MTILVGIICKDGIVIGADSASTFSDGQLPTIEQPVQKIDIIDNHVIVAGTGQVGLGQRFKSIVEKGWSNKVFQKDYLDVGKSIAGETIKDFASTNVQRNQYGALLAFPSKNNHYLCEFSCMDFQPEFKEIKKIWYVSMGSGQRIADPFLGFLRTTFWHDGSPNHQDAIFAAVWTLQHAIQLNPGGVNEPIQIAVLKARNAKLEARFLTEDELAEHRQNVKDAVSHLRDYRSILQGKNAKLVADIPLMINYILSFGILIEIL